MNKAPLHILFINLQLIYTEQGKVGNYFLRVVKAFFLLNINFIIFFIFIILYKVISY